MTKYITIVYHSAVGSTKFISNLIYKNLRDDSSFKVDIFSIEDKDVFSKIENSDYLVIGFPTYHANPSKSILDFISRVDSFKRSIPCFIFTTCGWFSANTLLEFSKVCKEKNIITAFYKSYRTPASDGAILFPSLKFFQQFEKNILSTIKADCKSFLNNIETGVHSAPKFKLYSILNYPNKAIAGSLKMQIKVNYNSCIKCNICINNCPHLCISKDNNNFPVVDKTLCENCYRCIHLCSKKALYIKKKNFIQYNISYYDNIIE